MAKRFTLAAIIEGKDKLSGVMDGISQGAMMRFGGMATDLVSQLPGLAVELVNLGAQAEAMEHRFTQFAGGADRAAEFLQAFQDAGDGTISKMDAMAGGAKLLQMQLVSNADEMKSVASIALKLGDQTQGAGDRIADFAALLANQSIPRLDNFGISSGKVRARIDELIKSGEALDREEAFKMAVMEEGGKALEILGDTSDLTSTKIDKLKAAVEDAKLGFAEMAVDALDAAGGVDGIAASIRGLPDTVRQLGILSDAGIAAVEAFLRGEDAGEAFNQAMIESLGIVPKVTDAEMDMIMATDEFVAVSKDIDEVVVSTQELEDRFRTVSKEAQTMADGSGDVVDGFDTAAMSAQDWSDELNNLGNQAESAMVDLADGVNEAGRTFDVAAFESEKLAKALAEQEAAAIETKNATLDMTMSWKSFFDRNKEQAQDWVTRRETLETEHQARVKELQATGNAEQLAAEQERYNTELATMNTELAKQEEAQRQSMGRMVLQSFEAWATMKQIPADKMLEMRTAIASEYGLIDEETAATVTAMTASWETWATDFSEDADTVIGRMGDVVTTTGEVKGSLDEIPRRIDIDIVVNQRYGAGGELTLGAGLVEGFQGGTSFFGGGLAMVGERGPELVALPRGSRIHSAGATRNISNTMGSNNTVNIYDARAMALYLEEQRRSQRTALMRGM